MAKKSETLDSWRDFFRISNSDIFVIIEKAIRVASSDCPQEFRARRGQIAEILYSMKLTKCLGSDQVELSVPGGEVKEEFGSNKQSKVNSSRDDQVEEMNMNQVTNYSYAEAEALTNEIEEAGQIVGEVLRIKEILDNSPNESDSVLLESLRKLELMGLSVDTLGTTEIGKSVNVLRKHVDKDVCLLARKLIDLWKVMVDEWVSAATAVTEATPESENPSTVEEVEQGLPSPPLDELALFMQPTDIDFSQFFDGIDDDGNTRDGGEFNRDHDNGRKLLKASPYVSQRKPQTCHEPYVPEMVKRDNEDKKQEVVIEQQSNVVKPKKPLNTISGPGRPEKVSSGQKVGNGAKIQQKAEKPAIQKKAASPKQEFKDHAEKLEASKRMLRERYQEAQTAKRQRTIQVMELHDLPKAQPMRPGNRNWANGRR